MPAPLGRSIKNNKPTYTLFPLSVLEARQRRPAAPCSVSPAPGPRSAVRPASIVNFRGGLLGIRGKLWGRSALPRGPESSKFTGITHDGGNRRFLRSGSVGISHFVCHQFDDYWVVFWCLLSVAFAIFFLQFYFFISNFPIYIRLKKTSSTVNCFQRM